MRFILLLTLLSLCDYSVYAQQWYEASNPDGGFIFQVIEGDNSDLFAASSRGLYRSQNEGESWESIYDEYASLPFLDFDISNSGTYYSVVINQLWKSIDNGQNWVQIEDAGWGTIRSTIVDDSGTIYLSSNSFIWKSEDEGNSWTQLTTEGLNISVRDMYFDPTGSLYITTYNSKIYRSLDEGESWTELIDTESDVNHIAFDGSESIYAASRFNGIFASNDGGNSWYSMEVIPELMEVLTLGIGADGEIMASNSNNEGFFISMDGENWEDFSYNLLDNRVGNILLSSWNDLIISTNTGGIHRLDGEAWTPQNDGISARSINNLDSDDDGNLFVCTSQGLMKSSDGGLNWSQSILGMDEADILAFDIAPDGDYYAGGEMLYRSEDGVNWENIGLSFPDGEVYIEDITILDDGRIVIATEDYSIRYSDSDGANWAISSAGLLDVTTQFITAAPNGYLFTSDAYELYRTNDLSGTWEIITNDLPEGDILELTVGNGVLFAITYSDGLYRSTDNGDSWELSIDQSFTNVVARGNEIYASSESVLDGGLYYSSDNGETWSVINQGLPGIQLDYLEWVEGLGLFANVRSFGLYTLDFSVISVSENEASRSDLKCFPNPFQNTFNIEFGQIPGGILEFRITNLEGKVLERIQLTNGQESGRITATGINLSPGMYILQAITGNEIRATQIIKK